MSSVWHDSWLEARRAFIEAIQSVNGVFDEIPIASKSPEGVRLSIGVGIVSLRDGKVIPFAEARNDRLLIHTSGVHGVEGFAGSAVQIDWLFKLRDAEADDSNQSGEFTIVLIHAVNPWGMSWLRRVNEHNVDLNRNALDKDAPLPNSSAYMAIRPILMCSGPSRFLWLLRLGLIAMQIGVDGITQALTGGQYVDETGFYYGGKSWQPELLDLKEYLKSKFSNARSVVAIDVHTGLGPFGHESLFARADATQDEVRRLCRQLDRNITFDAVDGKPSYHISGGFTNVITQSFTNAHVDTVLQEFGTFSPFKNLRGFYHEHHGWLAKKFGPGHKASSYLKDLFDPKDENWRQMVLDKSRTLIDRAILMLSSV